MTETVQAAEPKISLRRGNVLARKHYDRNGNFGFVRDNGPHLTMSDGERQELKDLLVAMGKKPEVPSPSDLPDRATIGEYHVVVAELRVRAKAWTDERMAITARLRKRYEVGYRYDSRVGGISSIHGSGDTVAQALVSAGVSIDGET